VAISPSYSLPREKIRNPLVAAFCGACCIGLGQFYNGSTLDGLTVWTGFLVPFILAVTFPAFFGFFIFTAVGVWIYGIYDAYIVSGRINKEEITFNGISELFFFPVLLSVSAGCAFAVYWTITAFIGKM
jgi:hypothetical protein